MAIQLRQDEQVQCEANFHWSSYLIPGIWAFVFTLSAFGQLLRPQISFSSVFFTLLIAAFPITFVWLRNKNKAYVVTNQRLYVENGILMKSKTDIPFHKINDISFNQGLFQRILGTGDISVMTGNDKPTKLANLSLPEKFREALSAICHKKSAS